MQSRVRLTIHKCLDNTRYGKSQFSITCDASETGVAVNEMFRRVGIDLENVPRKEDWKTSSDTWWWVEPQKRFAVQLREISDGCGAETVP